MSVFLGWPLVWEEILGQKNLPELLLRAYDGGGCSMPGWKQNSRDDEFELALLPLLLPWRCFAPRGGQVGQEGSAGAVVVSPVLACVLIREANGNRATLGAHTSQLLTKDTDCS